MNPTINNHSIVHLSITASWQCGTIKHTDTHHFEKFNVWRDADLLPPQLGAPLIGGNAGLVSVSHHSAGELVEPWSSHQLHTVPLKNFNRQFRSGMTIEPYQGRFYPQGIFQGIRDSYSENMFPVRLTQIDTEKEKISVDFNHPLAKFPVDLSLQVYSVEQKMDEHGGRCNDAVAELLLGPGMQCRYDAQATDFQHQEFYQPVDEDNDAFFYAMPRMVQHIDAVALQQLQQLYGKLVPKNGVILDLMASWDSHLPESLQPKTVIGLGMNSDELQKNSLLSERLIHDLNLKPTLPFADNHFDAVICSLSVEYLTNPTAVFAEIARVVKPGGLFINTFSNRWFPTKSISLWANLHEFERLALVTEYYLQNGSFCDIETVSIRGLSRNEDDPHILKSWFSDPLYAVWGRKQS